MKMTYISHDTAFLYHMLIKSFLFGIFLLDMSLYEENFI